MLTDLRIDDTRLLQRLDDLACHGAREDGGVSRLALTDADKAGRDQVVAWMRRLGLDVTIDAIGNIHGTRRGRSDGPPVMTGSHIDTVATGGLYDGNLGGLAGLEVIEVLNAARLETTRPVAVGFFTNEEGARFAPDMMGSGVHQGSMDLEACLAAVDVNGATVEAELARIGFAGDTPCGNFRAAAFFELHIEQGPVLEREGITIGAVTGVQGISWTELVLSGQSNHAGTTPMGLRRDPMVPAAQIAVFVRDMSDRLGGSQVGTVGALTASPNLVNVVPASVTMTVDLRNTDEDLLQEAERRLAGHLDRLAADEGVDIETRVLARFEPVTFDPDVIGLVAEVARDLGHDVRRLPSGAGHDAQMLARVCPTGMVFVPSVGGISHNPAEHTDPVDITAGADVLLRTLVQLATIDSEKSES